MVSRQLSNHTIKTFSQWHENASSAIVQVDNKVAV